MPSLALVPPAIAECGASPAPVMYAFEKTPLQARQDHMAWEGTIGDAIDQLRPHVTANTPAQPKRSFSRFIGVQRNTPAPAEPTTLGDLFWHPSLIMRGIIDSHVKGRDRVELVTEATRFALRMYANGHGELNRLEAKLKEARLLDMHVSQDRDNTTAMASSSIRSRWAAEGLNEKVGDRPGLMIPLCHGGFAAGIQTALSFRRLRATCDWQIYPTRYSRTKSKDRVPRLQPDELDLIERNALGRYILVFDEDAFGGRTVADTVRFLKHRIPGQILGMVNLDSRTDKCLSTQGEWWENV